jgi:hypothetical protein
MKSRIRLPLDAGDTPGNPLRSLRMSMLAHGFVQKDQRGEYELDEHDPLAYGLVRPGGRMPVAALVTVIVTIAIIVVIGALLA